METYEAIRTMLAVRQYRDQPIPDEVVRKIIEAAWLTGSSRNGQPWHFIVVHDRERLRELGAAAPSGPYTAEAAIAVAVAVERESRFGLSDGSRAIQSMMLAAWSEGVGSNWVGFGDMTEVARLLNVPESLEVIALVPFGYPAKRLGKGKKNRKPLGEVASSEQWGRPFA